MSHLNSILLVFVILNLTGCAGTSFRWEDAERVRVGMHYDEVRAILGHPYKVVSTGPTTEKVVWTIVSIFHESRMVVYFFEDSRVINWASFSNFERIKDTSSPMIPPEDELKTFALVKGYREDAFAAAEESAEYIGAAQVPGSKPYHLQISKELKTPSEMDQYCEVFEIPDTAYQKNSSYEYLVPHLSNSGVGISGNLQIDLSMIDAQHGVKVHLSSKCVFSKSSRAGVAQVDAISIGELEKVYLAKISEISSVSYRKKSAQIKRRRVNTQELLRLPITDYEKLIPKFYNGKSKGKFESQEEYKQRIATLSKEASSYTFIADITPELLPFGYDADFEVVTYPDESNILLHLPTGGAIGDITVWKKTTPVESYIGQNSYGSQYEVLRASLQTGFLRIMNGGQSSFKDTVHLSNSGITLKMPLSRIEARKIFDDVAIRLIAEVRDVPANYDTDFHMSDAKSTDSVKVDSTHAIYYIHATLTHLILFNQKTKQIYYMSDP